MFCLSSIGKYTMLKMRSQGLEGIFILKFLEINSYSISFYYICNDSQLQW